jgi:sulfoxide reductase heme-binding subunit YedZ
MTRRRLALIKLAVALGCLAPVAWIVLRGFEIRSLSLGANPVEEVLHTMGKTALNLLLLTLAVTPLRRLTGLNWLVGLRRRLGLFCFAYLVLHLLTYAVLDQRLALGSLLVDVTERPYITVGMLAFVLMIPLAVTSTNAMQRRLGRNWVKLHALVYPIGVLALVHFFWQTKADVSEPLVYAAALALLLGYRVKHWLDRRRATNLRAGSRGQPA